MATERVVDLGWMFKARLPVVPNFIISDDCGTSLPVQAFTDEALRKIGAAWTEALIAKAAERRKGPEMATVTREQMKKALSSLSALEGMASGYCELQDGFDTSKGIAENVRQVLAALAATPAEDEHALPTKADAWSLHAYVVDHAADHDDDCPGDDTCDCQFRARNEAVSRCVRWLIERPRAPQAPPASDPPRLGCESPSNCDPKLDLCTHCQARTAPNGLTPPSWITARQSDPPGLYRQGQEDMRRRVLDIVRDPSDCHIVKKLPVWGVPGMAEAAAAVDPLVERLALALRAQQATGGSDASDFRMRQSDPPGLVANWRPIETAPKRTDVLAGWADRPHWLPQVLQQDDAGMWFNGEESDYRPPTHWMPLPASPQAETKGDE